MPIINYQLVGICDGGDHATLDVTFNGITKRITYSVDEEIRPPLSSLTSDERAQLALLIAKVHFAGRTRAQIAAEINQPGGVTVTI